MQVKCKSAKPQIPYVSRLATLLYLLSKTACREFDSYCPCQKNPSRMTWIFSFVFVEHNIIRRRETTTSFQLVELHKLQKNEVVPCTNEVLRNEVLHNAVAFGKRKNKETKFNVLVSLLIYQYFLNFIFL